MIAKQVASEVGTAAAKLTPPAAVVAARLGGLSLQDWVYIVTIAYVVMQGAHLAWKWVKEWRASRVTA
jgi:uncharacterized ion transporter superfamily protein YfcC